MEHIAISELTPASYNPRTIRPEKLENLKRKIEKDPKFFEKRPCLVNRRDGKLIVYAGNQRLQAAKELGWDKVPCDVENNISIELEKERNVNDNVASGDWDYQILAEHFSEELLKMAGFERQQLDKLKALKEDSFKVRNEYDQIEKPNTLKGDVYRLGEHRLMCGDSTSMDDVRELTGGVLADIVITDPPYNIGLEYHSARYKGQKQFSDNKKPQDYRDFLTKVINNAIESVKENAAIYFWCDETYIDFIQSIYRGFNLRNKRVCLWIKENFKPTPQVGFNKVYEPCVLAWKGKPYINKEERKWDEILNENDNLEDYFTIWFDRRDSKQDYDHPTQKPLTLLNKPLRMNSQQGEIVLDLCGGSGSTLLACEQLGRNCYTMELDPIYCDLIVKRWEQFTGRQAEKVL